MLCASFAAGWSNPWVVDGYQWLADGLDVKGRNLGKKTCQVSVQSCADRCSGNERCMGFVYVTEGTYAECCFMKDSARRECDKPTSVGNQPLQ